ncbi:MAG: DUF362 domain-containing protein [Peptococcaceae bacterium]|nr:DUF362 domain-containing protein [Peptococcaceae bacterium]
MPDVFMVGARAAGVRDNHLDKLALLLSAPGFAEMIPISKKKYTFIKANYSQMGYTRHIRPILLRSLVERIKEMGGTPAVTDTTGFFPKGHYTGEEWFEAAEMMGYSELALGCERILANGFEGNDGEFVSTGGAELGGVEVARVIVEAECVVMVSHVTAHPLAGISGALVNLGVECLNNFGKTRIYQDLKPQWLEAECGQCGACVEYCQWQALEYDGKLRLREDLCSGCATCVVVCRNRARRPEPEQIKAFQRRVAESSAAIVKTLDKKIIYVNLLTDIVPQPDRFSWSDVPFVPDMGFLASTDPVALDAVTVELVRRAPGVPDSAAEDAGALEPGCEKFRALTGADPLYLLEHAERMGVGSRRYEVFIPGGEAR